MRVWLEGLKGQGAVSCKGGNLDEKEGISIDQGGIPWIAGTNSASLKSQLDKEQI